MSEIIQSQRRRGVPNVGTLENPPGSETREGGPAWALPELIVFAERLQTTTAVFNTCAFQDKMKDKWFKPGRVHGMPGRVGIVGKEVQLPGRTQTSVAGGKGAHVKGS